MADQLWGSIATGDLLPELVVDVTATTVVTGSVSMGDWSPAHHDHSFAVHHLAMADIFLSTPAQAAWFERFVTDWTGPKGRLGRLNFRMRAPITAGSSMVLTGEVSSVGTDDLGCGWVDVDLAMSVDDVVCSLAEARVALPVSGDDNPWTRRGDRWRP